ncbi:PcfJ domain-containing protein [Butyrivibrio sp. FCS014]|uniref:PcfJ domain-containing protein n=1 Tax=Butyrivibrio sp. FCS014 TaxID=1408304 RepID=UPI000463DD5B|nr:PcfJ domain-containing protein [Butyrivibrio sp. FCS014]
MSEMTIEKESFTCLFRDIEPTWEELGFDEDIPGKLMAEAERAENNYIYATIIGDRLVYRSFSMISGKPCENYRYVFHRNIIVKESRTRVYEIVTPQTLTGDKAKDITAKSNDYFCGKLFDMFRDKVEISNKWAILRTLPYVKTRYPKFGFKPFLEIYIKSREDGAILHSPQKPLPHEASASARAQMRHESFASVPKLILHELYGRSHKDHSAVRLTRNLVVVTGEKSCRYLNFKEQTRVYFDATEAYYFVKNAVTGMWQREEIAKDFELETDLRERLVDRELFTGTFGEQFAENAVHGRCLNPDMIVYGSLLAQAGFLSAEQAAKSGSPVYHRLLESIYSGKTRDSQRSLPELLGVTGPQLKFFKGIDLTDDLEEFGRNMKDAGFIRYYPDIQKRIYAVSLFMNWAYNSYFECYRDDARQIRLDLCLGANTICSIEKYSGEKRYRLSIEYRDYLRMRRSYLAYMENMREDDPIRQEIAAFGDAPINIKPSKIHDMHNKLGEIVGILSRNKTISECDKDIISRKEHEAKDIEYYGKDYSIIMPKDATDIIREGRILHHCVGHGGYIEAMARKECRILFLRDNTKPDKPLITIEERGGRIRQCYGFADSLNRDAGIRAFIKQYASEHNFAIDAAI